MLNWRGCDCYDYEGICIIHMLCTCDMGPGMEWIGSGHMLLMFNEIIYKNFSTSQSLIHNDTVHGSVRALRLQMV